MKILRPKQHIFDRTKIGYNTLLIRLETISKWLTLSSMQSMMTVGYFLESQRKNAGTPIVLL